MNTGKYVFSQIVEFLPKRYFERLIINCKDRTVNYLSALETFIPFRFRQKPINRSSLSKVNNLRNPEIFEQFAFHIVSMMPKLIYAARFK